MKTYQTNTKLYLVLLGSSFFVAILSLFIPLDSKWFVIVSGISCGGIASVIIAWIIDIATCREKSLRSSNIYSMLSGSLLFITYAYASMFQRIVGNESAKEKQTWIEWANLLNSCLETRPEESVPEELVKVFNNWTENAKQQISFIINQRIQLMADGLMSMEIYSSLSQINDIIGFCEYELHHKRYKNAAKSLSALANALESYFQSNTEFQRYNTICFNTLEEFIEGFILTNRLES